MRGKIYFTNCTLCSVEMYTWWYTFTCTGGGGLHWTVLGWTGLWRAVLGCAGLYWTVLVFTKLNWAVVGCRRLYCSVLGCTGRSQQLFVCVFSRFWHGDKQSNNQPGDPRAGLLFISVRRQSKMFFFQTLPFIFIFHIVSSVFPLVALVSWANSSS